MGVPNRQSVKRTSQNRFIDLVSSVSSDPSVGNLYSVVFDSPPAFRAGGTPNYYKKWGGNPNHELAETLNAYANAINLPSKQLTTGQVVTQGTPFKYVTGSAYSQINITFMIPRNHSIRTLFEAWMNTIIVDSNHYVEDYDEYVAKRLRIYKLERGFGPRASRDSDFTLQVRKDYGRKEDGKARLNQVTACYELRNVFPFNIGSAQLNNMDARIMTYTIGFNFERYRFYSQEPAELAGGDYATKTLRERIAESGNGGRMGRDTNNYS